MKELNEKIKIYKEKNLLTDEKCAENLSISLETLIDIQNNAIQLDKDEQERILAIVNIKPKTGRRIVKILDLLFRLISTIMPLVVILLCVNHYQDMRVMIVLLAIGFTCSSMTILPKIEK